MSDAPLVDLSNCDREPIHVLGNVQPFGFLLAVNGEWLVTRVSANTAAFIGTAPEAILGQPLTQVFSETAVHALRNRLALLRGADTVERLFAVRLVEGRPAFDVALHYSADAIVIEAEPAAEEEREASAMVRAMIARLNQTESFNSFLREGARQVRALTGFDRVKVYRFDEQGSGEVVAESLRPGVDSFLGLHYPATDIPAQARKLYLRNIFRVIADVNATPVPIISAGGSQALPLDQSLSVLRAVSPIHIEYLRNMGVDASLSISIIVEGKLWGLFACHHYAPRLPSFAYRTAAELFGQMFSLMLESRERREAADYETHARAMADRLMTTLAQDGELLVNAPWLGDAVIDTIPSDGVGVFLNGTISLSGLTPDREHFAEIIQLLNQAAGGEVFATDCMQRLLPDAARYADRAAGFIAIPLSRRPRDYVVLFRSERLRSVRWAGNPEKPVEFGPNGARLTPRKSFEAWSELVKGCSVPFTAAERRVADTLRTGMREVLARLSDTADEERRRAHERQEFLIAELNHRVRNILALIRGLISQTRSGAVTVESFITNLDDRVQALARAHDQITADRWGPAHLSDLIETEAGAYLGEKRGAVRLGGPPVLIQPGAFTALALVVHELMTNAAKYGALSDGGVVRIAWELDVDGNLLIDWKEEGGPPVTAPSRRGFGTTIIEQSIPFDLGGRSEVRYEPGGMRAHFFLPASHVAGLAEHGKGATRAGNAVGTQYPLKGRTVLLVEDSMIIALDAEEILKGLGAVKVTTVSNVPAAWAAMDATSFDFGLLDLNLGSDTSLGVADRLAERAIPFIFATGYGEDNVFLTRHRERPVINKPYGAAQIAGALAKCGLS